MRNRLTNRQPFRFNNGQFTLSLHVQPGAVKSGPAGKFGESAFKLKLSEPAIDGKANKACIKFFSHALGIPVNRVTLLRGTASRDKTIRIESLTREQVDGLLKLWSNE